jgi:preprotein translocase subunit SecY
VGLRIRIPGIRYDWLTRGIWETNDSALLKFFDTITGHGLARGSMLALSITPFLAARFYVWLAKKVFPRVAALDEHAAGRVRLDRWTRGLNLGIALVQSYGYARFLQSVPNVVVTPGPAFVLGTMAMLTSGAVFLMHLSERVPADDDARSSDNATQGRAVDIDRSVDSEPVRAALNAAPLIEDIPLIRVHDRINTK